MQANKKIRRHKMKNTGVMKLIQIIIALSLLLVMAACGSSGSGDNSSTKDTATPDKSDPKQAKAEIVEIVAWDKPREDSPNKALTEKNQADFAAKYPNIKVKHVEQVSGQEREQFITAVAGGEQPDVVKVAFPSMEAYISQGIAADITDLWNNFSEKDMFVKGAFGAGTLDGRIYGIPAEMYTTGLYYNKQIFKDAGLDPNKPPATWDEFIDAAKKTHNPSKEINGFDILGMDWADWHFEYYVWAAGGDLTEKLPDGSVKLTFTEEPAVAALQFYKDLKWTHGVTQKNVIQALDENQKDFYTGHAAMIVGASDNYGWFVSKGMNPDDIGFAPFPAGPSGKAPAQVGGAYYILNPKASKEQMEAAFTYATYSVSKDVVDANYDWQKENGVFINLLSIRSDVDMSDKVDVSPDILENINKAAANPQLEYFLKDRLSPYVVNAIQKILLDKDADPLTELQKAENLAQKEIADNYNEEIKK
jgi:multiple sugar transport system substrate-binding protein